MFIKKPTGTIAALASLSLVLSACSTATEEASPSQSASATATATGEVVIVHAAFYPLEFLAKTIGGDQIQVVSLTVPGAEPHDMELTPVQVAELEKTSLVLFIDGFMPAVDEAIEASVPDRALDLGATVTLLESDDHDHAHETPAPEASAAAEEEHDHGAYDPHIWLDPANMVLMANAVSERLIAIDPDRSDFYTANTAALVADLEALDQEFTTGLANCEQKEIVTSHDAFGYLANAYGFKQHGIAGLSPESEPSPARLAEISEMVRAEGITTIYYETLVSPAIAETVANETGATTAVLDPIEGLVEGSTDTFITVMQANLQALIKGQTCS
ncbi:MAG: metal ABC transporter substrate-binding protein [Actinobacteria bacterium]|nr:metal ABC transporter substrate-binding protein [Actinomycetota bacterium]